jgi:peptidoglycan hydrolase-like amidase
MSQWGAFGYARHGWSWQRILAHYYQGTRIAPAPLSRVRLLLVERKCTRVSGARRRYG